jgi:GNAT superfamily N-acetyltransferase
MTWPAFITDGKGQKFTFHPSDYEEDGAYYYQADLLAEDGEEAGYLWFRDEGKDGMLLHDVEVYEKFSGAGLGLLLIQIVEDEATRLGKNRIFGHIEARCQLSGQKEKLAAWYRRLGYTVVRTDSVPADYYGTLEKKLPEPP